MPNHKDDAMLAVSRYFARHRGFTKTIPDLKWYSVQSQENILARVPTSTQRIVAELVLSKYPLGPKGSVVYEFRGTGTLSYLSDTWYLQLRACGAK